MSKTFLDDVKLGRILCPLLMDTSGKALLNHWTWAAEKGLMNAATAASLKSACSKVIKVLDDWETVNVRELDIEHTILRFQNLCAREFTPKSLETYASRFRKAIGLFVEYADNPSTWRVSGKPKKQKNADQRKNGGASGGTAVPTSKLETGQSAQEKAIHNEGHLITYPFPLRRGLTVKVSLPEDLSSTEARRLSAFLMTLANDYTDHEE
jgi:hypothetical protein